MDQRNRELLELDLRAKRLVFESRPYEAHVQFSNFCNMSCIMCHNGKNPPLKRMSDAVLGRLHDEVAPDLTFITPHDGSEPTVVTWDETVALAKDCGVRLWLTTNGQVFDEQKFHECKDVLDLLTVSVDSHLPEVFEAIRPGAKAEKVFRNLEAVARLSTQHGIQCMVTAVFMTLNAPSMPDTVAWVADRGVQVMTVTQMIDTNRESWHLDATMHFSAEYLDWIKQQCVAVAQDRKMLLCWYLADHEWFDFRDPAERLPGSMVRHVHYAADERRRLLHPGYCDWAASRLRICADGQVSPCGLDTGRDLDLGNLERQSFDEIWNGPTAQDLRRAHFTWDYPGVCKSCRYTDLLPVQQSLPFLERHVPEWADVEPALAFEKPAHMLRAQEAPMFVMHAPPHGPASYRLLLSPGGQVEDTQTVPLEIHDGLDGIVGLAMPAATWDALETNIGYWWTVLATGPDGKAPVARTPDLRCLVRHEPMERVAGSSLRYTDEGHFPVLYLGGDRQLGWKVRGELPHRPPLRERREEKVKGGRFASRRRAPAVATGVPMDPEAYREMVHHIREVVAGTVPEGSIAVVATKGDPSLLDVEGRDLRHFPAGPDGSYAGHHPTDDAWAIEQLGRAQAAGAEFLVLPASTRWWLDHYRIFAQHLPEAIVDDRERCTIFDLRRSSDASRESAELVELADRTLGYGGHHRMAFRRFYGAEDDNPFPRFAVEAHGYTLVDSEGRRFVDWVSGAGPVILGYGHPAVTEAIASQLAVGPTLTVTHPVEVEVAELLTRMVPCAERVAFGKNGSDAVTAAVRLARAVTGREMILQYGGHGFHDWYVASLGVPGVPAALGALVRRFPYNDLDALAALFDEHAGEVAAIVMEPLNIELPEAGYLEGVRELAHGHGALLVFDEVITALRLGPGGAQERCGVVPDLACLGKALANGMPLSAVVGKREYMERLPEVAYGMTFRGETLSLAAARAVLLTVQREGVAEHLERVGAQVRAAFDRRCAEAGMHATLRGPEARMTFVFGDHAAVPYERLEAAFVLECARQGVLVNNNVLPSFAHDDEAVRLTDEAFGPALAAARALADAGVAAVGEAVRAGFAACGTQAGQDRPPAGFLDAARDEGGHLLLRGWLLPDAGEPCTIVVRGPRGAERVAGRVERGDVAATYPDVAAALRSGFSLSLPPEEFVADGRWDVTICAMRGDETLFAGRLTRPRLTYDAADLRPSSFRDGVLNL